MWSTKREIQLLVALTTLLLLALAAGCQGFFVNPTLTTITVTPPTPSIVEGKTQQMTATGSYDDGSTKNITGDVSWTTTDQTKATVSGSGLVKGIAPGSATITATSAGIVGSTSVSVTFADLTGIDVSPQNQSFGPGVTTPYTATGHFSGGPDQDITTQVTWTATPSSAATISNTPGTQGQLTTLQVQANTTVTVTATSGSIFGTATLTVTP